MLWVKFSGSGDELWLEILFSYFLRHFFFHLSFLYREEIPAQCIWTQSISSHSLSLSFFFFWDSFLELFVLLVPYYCLFSSSCIYVNFNYKMLFCYPFCNLGMWYTLLSNNWILLFLSILWWIFFICPLKDIYSFSILLCSLEIWAIWIIATLGSCQYRNETILGTLERATSLAI